jgi:hypothetical protein
MKVRTACTAEPFPATGVAEAMTSSTLIVGVLTYGMGWNIEPSVMPWNPT